MVTQNLLRSPVDKIFDRNLLSRDFVSCQIYLTVRINFSGQEKPSEIGRKEFFSLEIVKGEAFLLFACFLVSNGKGNT